MYLIHILKEDAVQTAHYSICLKNIMCFNLFGLGKLQIKPKEGVWVPGLSLSVVPGILPSLKEVVYITVTEQRGTSGPVAE